MGQINRDELTMEQINKAMACKNADELLELAKEEGFDLTREEAEAYMDEMSHMELDEEALGEAAGGGCRSFTMFGKLAKACKQYFH